MVDLEHLERYIVIPVGGVKLADVDDLRELEGDWGSGVYLLWSDERYSVVAFVFEKTIYDIKKAKAWVEKAMEKPKRASRREPSDLAVKVLAARLNPRPRSEPPIIA